IELVGDVGGTADRFRVVVAGGESGGEHRMSEVGPLSPVELDVAVDADASAGENLNAADAGDAGADEHGVRGHAASSSSSLAGGRDCSVMRWSSSAVEICRTSVMSSASRPSRTHSM